MKIEGKEYRTIWFENNTVKIINQTKLPHQFIIKDLKTVKDVINAIKIMEKWVSISAQRHIEFENMSKAKTRHKLKLDKYILKNQ